MSAGLTIEQVLARSLRMPRRRLAAQSAIAKTMDRAEAQHAAAQQQQQIEGASNPATVRLSDVSSSSAAAMLDGSQQGAVPTNSTVSDSHAGSQQLRTQHQQQPPVVTLPSATSKQSQRYSIPIPKEDPDPYPTRPLLRRVPQQGLARNCDDLLTNLIACKQLGDWRDALTVFAAHPHTMSVSRAHVTALVETLVSADKAHVISDMAQTNKFASDAQADLALRCTATSLNRKDMWKEALAVLSSMRHSPAPIEAYNEIVSACEASGAWKEAMKIVFDLKDKHDQYITALSDYERSKAEAVLHDGEDGSVPSSAAESDDLIAVGSSSTSLAECMAADGASRASSSSTVADDPNAPKQQYPKPDAVTWTTLITLLEKCGKDDLAQEVLRVVPPTERETILASYAALIYTWSHQKKKRF